MTEKTQHGVLMNISLMLDFVYVVEDRCLFLHVHVGLLPCVIYATTHMVVFHGIKYEV